MKALKKLNYLVVALLIFLLMSTPAIALTSVQVLADADASIVYGKEALVTGYLWPAGANYAAESGINDQTLMLQSRIKGTTTWEEVISVETEAVEDNGTTYNGIVAAGGGLNASTEFKWVYAGDNTYAATESNVVTTEVAPTVSLKASANRPKGILTLKGTVSPTHRGKNVKIKVKKQGGGWSALATVKTDANSNFKHNWKIDGKSGVFSFVAYFVADTDHAQGKSKTVKARI